MTKAACELPPVNKVLLILQRDGQGEILGERVSLISFCPKPLEELRAFPELKGAAVGNAELGVPRGPSRAPQVSLWGAFQGRPTVRPC